MGEIEFSLTEVRTENGRVYYRVSANGFQLPATVSVLAGLDTPTAEEDLKIWCARNIWRLETLTLIQADLPEAAGKKKARGA
ncbi:MAG TPA: hypothetical protein VLC94_11000 [Candidatus Acidoferrum sp.]|nr:hypothetical protein [Candidatus Acidoferrum sp.]